MPFRWWVTTFFVSFSFPSVLHNLTKPRENERVTKLMSQLGAAQNSFQPASIRPLNNLKAFFPRISFAPGPSWKFLQRRLLAFATSSTLLVNFKESVSTCSIYRRSFITISLFPFFLFFFFGISGRPLLCFWRRSRGEQAQLRSRGFARSLRVAVHRQEHLPRSQESRQLHRLPFLPLFPHFFPFFSLYSDERKLQQIC